MSLGYKVLSAVVLWLVVGLCVTGLAGRVHPEWYALGSGFNDRFMPSVVISVVGWPITVLAFLGDAVLPPVQMSPKDREVWEYEHEAPAPAERPPE